MSECFLKPVQAIKACTVDGSSAAAELASPSVTSRLKSGRHAIEVINGGSATVYIGNKDVTEENGLPVEAGASRFIPVYPQTKLFVTGGSVTLVEYFG